MKPELDLTQALADLRKGDTDVVERIFPLVYDEMRRLARIHLSGERPDHTLQATALVHEAYLRLVDQRQTDYQNRNHFFAIAAQAIRRVLVDHARKKARKKRGGGVEARALLDTAVLHGDARAQEDLLALDEALSNLTKTYPTAGRVVELRFYGGLTHAETADVLEVSERTTRNHWEFARTWLFQQLRDEAE